MGANAHVQLTQHSATKREVRGNNALGLFIDISLMTMVNIGVDSILLLILGDHEIFVFLLSVSFVIIPEHVFNLCTSFYVVSTNDVIDGD